MVNKTLLITGSSGQLGMEYQLGSPLENWECVFMDRKSLDITNKKDIERSIEKIDAVLNLAAYTDLEKAEKKDTDKAYSVNTDGPKILAIECNKRNIPLIHISTDYVFDGQFDGAYIEEHEENPINKYGATKFLGEKCIQENHDWYYILRTSWLYSNHSRNFFTTMLSLSQERSEITVVDDQFGSPTSTRELCRAIDVVINNLDKTISGVYHFAGMGKTTWKDFAQEIFNQCKIHVSLRGISTEMWTSNLKRPHNSYLSSDKFSTTFGYTPAHWKNALREIVSDRKILPVKVGDSVVVENIEFMVVSTDWLKRLARISPIDDMVNSVEIPFDMLNVYERK